MKRRIVCRNCGKIAVEGWPNHNRLTHRCVCGTTGNLDNSLLFRWIQQAHDNVDWHEWHPDDAIRSEQGDNASRSKEVDLYCHDAPAIIMETLETLQKYEAPINLHFGDGYMAGRIKHIGEFEGGWRVVFLLATEGGQLLANRDFLAIDVTYLSLEVNAKFGMEITIGVDR